MMAGWGVDPGVLPAFALAMVLVELTPGPNLAWLALLSAARGRRAGLTAVAGITVGLAVWLGVALFGLTRTPLQSTLGLEVLRWVGAAWLVWLAWEPLRGGSAPPVARREAGGARPFLHGVAVNLLNPKAAIFYLAVLPGFIKPAAGPLVGQVLILGGLHILIAIAVHSAAVFGAAAAAARLPPRWAFGFRLTLALGLLATAVWMVSFPLDLTAAVSGR